MIGMPLIAQWTTWLALSGGLALLLPWWRRQRNLLWLAVVAIGVRTAFLALFGFPEPRYPWAAAPRTGAGRHLRGYSASGCFGRQPAPARPLTPARQLSHHRDNAAARPCLLRGSSIWRGSR